MRQPVTRDPSAQAGFALAAVLALLAVLAVSGAMVVRNVRTDVTHSGRDLDRIRAEFAAESAVQWALAELSRQRPGGLPFTRATHGPDGSAPLPERAPDGKPNARKLRPDDLAAFPGGKHRADAAGWIELHFPSREAAITGGPDERMAFKAWYPNDSTLRITGRGSVAGAGAQVELVSVLREVAVPF